MALDDVALLARVLAPGGDPAARGTAERVLADLGLGGLRDADVTELARGEAIDALGAERLVASVELGRRVHGVVGDGPIFRSPETVALHARDIREEAREHFVVFLLNSRHRIVGRELISLGSLSASIVHPREVFRKAILNAAAAIVVVHNHPSGDPEPSRDDVEITRRLVRAGHLIGIPVLDHVIVAGERFRSLRGEGLVLFEWQETTART